MLHVVPVDNIQVGDVLAEGLVLMVDKTPDSEDVVFSVPTGQIHAKKRAKTFRITKLDKLSVNRFVKAMRTQHGTG